MSVSIDAFTVLPNVVKGPSAATWQYILVACCSNWWKQEIFLHTIWEFNVFFVCFFVGPVFHLFEWIDISYKKQEWGVSELPWNFSKAYLACQHILPEPIFRRLLQSHKWYDSLMSNSQNARHIGQVPVHQPTLSALANQDTLNLNPHVVYHNSRRHSVDAGTNNWSPRHLWDWNHWNPKVYWFDMIQSASIEDGNIMKYPWFLMILHRLRQRSVKNVKFFPSCPIPSLSRTFAVASVFYVLSASHRFRIWDSNARNFRCWTALHEGKNRVSGVRMDWFGMTCWPEKVLARGEMYFHT